LTQESLALAPRPYDWIDQAFLWTASSLTVITIAGALTSASRWPADAVRTLPFAAPRHAPAAPSPAIAFAAPVPGYPIISPFGLRQLPWEEAGRLHKGVDIAAPMGAPVLATADGVVTRIGVDPGYGRFLELVHKGGMSSLYGHLSAFEVRPGSVVKQGQPIGRIGSTGSSTGAHLHFEIHDPEGRALNPEMFLGKSFMRLADLPLKAAARLPRGPVRIAYVSFIPPAKAALMQARQAAETGEDPSAVRAAAADVTAPMLGVVPAEKVTLSAAAAEVIHIEGRGPDGRVRAVMLPAG